MRTPTKILIACGLTVAATLSVAPAWHGPGHDKADRLAAGALPKDMPAFFAAGADTIAHCAADPDLFRLKVHPQLRDAEAPEHYFDLEPLAGAAVPPTRSAFVAMCAKKRLAPRQVGTAAYAVVEWTQRLTIAFAEHRKWPKNKHIQAKCLVYAGLLSHYAQDVCQPLHTTIHFDGRADKDGSSPRTGIHARVDALLQKARADAKPAALKPAAYKDLFGAVQAEIRRSHALVDRVYELDKAVPAEDKPIPPGSAVARFADERLQACAHFTASLFVTAWRDSAKVKLPRWLNRKAQ